MSKLLELLLPLGVNLAIALLAALLVRAFRDPARLPRLQSPAEALRRFGERFPNTRGTAVLAADGTVALLALEDGRVGLLQRHGHRWNARILTPAQVRSVRTMPGGSVSLRLRDYTGPAVVLAPDPGGAAELWTSCLRRLLPAGAGPDREAGHHA